MLDLFWFPEFYKWQVKECNPSAETDPVSFSHHDSLTPKLQ